MHRLTGFPSPAEEYERAPLSLDGLLIPRPRQTFFVRLEGDALIDDGWQAGDLLVVERVLRFVPGTYVLAFVGSERLVRKFVQRDYDFFLCPVNKKYREIEVTDSVQLFGQVTHRITHLVPVRNRIQEAA